MGVIVGNPFLTMRVHLLQSPRGGCLYIRGFCSKLKRIEYRKVGHYVPKGFLTMNWEKVTKTCPMLFRSLRVLVY